MKPILTAISFSVAAASVAHADITGNWRTDDGTSVIRIAPCGDVYCGSVVAFDGPSDATDEANPSPDLRSRPVCGLRLLDGVEQEESGRHRGGTIYDPETGESYNVTLRKKDGNLSIRVFVGSEAFGETFVWTPADPLVPVCS